MPKEIVKPLIALTLEKGKESLLTSLTKTQMIVVAVVFVVVCF